MKLKRSFYVIVSFLSLLAVTSCEQSTIPKKGHFKYTKSISRSIASTSTVSKFEQRLLNKMNPIQAYLHCKIKKSNIAEKCYNDKIKSTFKKLSITKEMEQYQKIVQLFSYESIEKRTLEQVELATNEVSTRMLNILHKRVEFCKLNSKNLIKRCLTQYLSQDSTALVNDLQQRHPTINGLEYLFLKENLEATLEKKLLKQHVHLKQVI